MISRLYIFFFLFVFSSAHAQVAGNKPALKPFPSETVVSAGAGFSLYNVAARFQNAAPMRGRFSSGGVYGGIIETFLRPYLSVAIGYHQQTFTFTNQGNGYLQITRMNAGPRINFRLYKRSRFDFLLGARVGFTFYSYTGANVTLGTGFQEYMRFQETLNLQVLSAMRIYLTRSVGIVLESGIGVPYFLNGGICYRFGSSEGETNAPKAPDLRNRGPFLQ